MSTQESEHIMQVAQDCHVVLIYVCIDGVLYYITHIMEMFGA